jgi:hypothetical protein
MKSMVVLLGSKTATFAPSSRNGHVHRQAPTPIIYFVGRPQWRRCSQTFQLVADHVALLPSMYCSLSILLNL